MPTLDLSALNATLNCLAVAIMKCRCLLICYNFKTLSDSSIVQYGISELHPCVDCSSLGIIQELGAPGWSARSGLRRRLHTRHDAPPAAAV